MGDCVPAFENFPLVPHKDFTVSIVPYYFLALFLCSHCDICIFRGSLETPGRSSFVATFSSISYPDHAGVPDRVHMLLWLISQVFLSFLCTSRQLLELPANTRSQAFPVSRMPRNRFFIFVKAVN